uniref:SCP domain-containing protein n=1 Tax=Peronospora matthiolae TaxID=2874970 RepID=A0AAV1T9D5_9STRA
MPRIASIVLMAVSAIAALTAPTVLGFQPGSGGRVMWENNCDFQGQNYASMKAIPDVCGDVCAGDAACTHWAWSHYNGGTCWFKSGNRSSKIAKWGTNCGYMVSRSSQAQKQDQAAPSSGLSSAEMGEMLGRINAYRAQHGLPALSIDSRLVSAATLHSRDQANNCRMTHAGSNGSRLGDRVKAQGYDFETAAENVAGGQMTVEEVMTSWWNSPGHRANLLGKDVKNVGFGKVVNDRCGNFANYWTQDFGSLD